MNSTMSFKNKNEEFNTYKFDIIEPPYMKRISPIKYNINIEDLNCNSNSKKRKFEELEEIII